MSFAHTFGKLGLSNYYSQYFEALKLQKKTNDETIDWDKVYDTYAGYEYLLRSRQLYDKADALEIIVDTVQEQVENAETQGYTELPHILYFLTKLADQSPVDSKLPKFSSEVEKALTKKEFHKRQQPSTEEFFGTRISNYENAQRVNMDSPNDYFQYPAELFQEEPNQTLKEDFIPTELEHSEFNEFFKYGKLTESTTPRPSFFGGLKPLSDNQVDDCAGFNINFEIPSLPEVPYSVFGSIPDESSKPADRTYKLPKAATLPVTHKHNEPSESLAQIFPQSLKNVDASAGDTMIPNSWDTPALTQSNGLRPPYLSESDTRTFEVVYQKYFRGGNWEKSRSVVIETSAFMKALLNLVNGIVSRLFVYDQECRTFVFRVPHFRVQGLGTMSLHR
ncbi:hypothetical protein K7432_016564 [Basidiobolus ranarum]|uniref:Uncharacterized protein n=1 Tax=Basidiobolus ranarum TaxID=34480 RepID=A0ABR2WEK7_9FUNG